LGSDLLSRRSCEWGTSATLAESYRFLPCFKFVIVAQVFLLLCIYVIDLKSYVFCFWNFVLKRRKNAVFAGASIHSLQRWPVYAAEKIGQSKFGRQLQSFEDWTIR
jgi:hypothetical protein